ILAAVLAPLLRSADPDPPAPARERPRRRRRRTARSKPRGAPRKRKYKRHAPSAAREKALAALRAHPEATPTQVAKLSGVSRATPVSARKQLAKEERRAARGEVRKKTKPVPPDRRERAQQFLREQLARGAKQASVVEEAAAKAHIDEQALGQARADLGIVTSRSNAGGVQAVQWSLPG